MVEVYRNAPSPTVRLTFTSADGQELVIESTSDHPFYVVADEGFATTNSRSAPAQGPVATESSLAVLDPPVCTGFVAARDLAIGATCLSQDGTVLTLTARENVSEAKPVYNLHIDSAHTYYVGPSCKRSVLVHNECGLGPGQFLWAVGEGICIGIPRGVCNIGNSLWGTGREMAAEVVDVPVACAEIAGNVCGCNCRFDTYSDLGNASLAPTFNYAAHSGRLVAAVATVNTTEQAITTYELYNGTITVDEASGRYGSVGVIQLGSAYVMNQQGGVYHEPVQRVPAYLYEALRARVAPTAKAAYQPQELSPHAQWRFQQVEPFRLTLDAAQRAPIKYGGVRVYESARVGAGDWFVRNSGRVAGEPLPPYQFPQGITYSTCAAPRALNAALTAPGASGTATVTYGGMMCSNGRIYWIPPCETVCSPMLQMNPQISTVQPPPVRTLLECVPPVPPDPWSPDDSEGDADDSI